MVHARSGAQSENGRTGEIVGVVGSGFAVLPDGTKRSAVHFSYLERLTNNPKLISLWQDADHCPFDINETAAGG
jgi:hypothetical protein